MTIVYRPQGPPTPTRPARTPQTERCACDATFERTEYESPVWVEWDKVHKRHEEIRDA